MKQLPVMREYHNPTARPSLSTPRPAAASFVDREEADRLNGLGDRLAADRDVLEQAINLLNVAMSAPPGTRSE